MSFEFATSARIVFGRGSRDAAGSAAASFGQRALVVTGAHASRAAWLLDRLADARVETTLFQVAGEPSAEDIRRGATRGREAGCSSVIACGGGSAVDAGKAIAALLTNDGDVLDYVEIVGRGLPLTRPSAPLLAVPTTAGTGSEVTKNAVVGVPEHRVKVSMRSDTMLPRLALIDSDLTHSMPPVVTASTGLDALTHLIEAYLSNRANPLTDGLCREGIRRAAHSLREAYRDGSDARAREEMTLVSLFGGLALANARLGAVHGFAGPAGGMFDAPHGCLCGRFLPYVLEMNLRALEARAPHSAALPRFADVAGWLTEDNTASAAAGVGWIQSTCEELTVPSLGDYGATEADVPDLVEKAARASSMQGNPIRLERDELVTLARQAL